MTFIGIDPGLNGAVAILGAGPPAAWPMPATALELLELLREFAPSEADREAGTVRTRAVLEKLHAMPRGSIANWKLGQSVGWVEMALLAASIPYDETDPVEWQTAIGCPPARGKAFPGLPAAAARSRRLGSSRAPRGRRNRAPRLPAPSGRLRRSQRLILQELHRAGAKVLVARSVSTVMAALEPLLGKERVNS